MTLHPPTSVLSRRHAPSWLLLSFAAGAVNTIAFLACSRFVTHVTGSVSHVGMGTGSLTIAADYGIILGCFVMGAMASAMLIEVRGHQKRRPLYAVPLLAVICVLVGISVAGMAGVFGEFGGAIDGPNDLLFLSLLAFAMGLQNASVATSTGSLVRTTHMTGPATDLGVHLATAISVTGEPRRTAFRHAALRAGKIGSFTAGAAAGVVLASSLSYLAFLVPALIVVIATGLSFMQVPSTLEKEVLQ